MEGCFIVHTVLTSTKGEERKIFRNTIEAYDDCSDDAAEILMAVMFAFMTPTVGPGCWSGSCFLYGAIGSISWFIQLQKRPRGWWRVAASLFNELAFIWLIAAIVMQVSGLELEWKPMSGANED